MNALQAAQRINCIYRELELIGHRFDGIPDESELNEEVSTLLKEEGLYLDELKILQDKLECIEIVW